MVGNEELMREMSEWVLRVGKFDVVLDVVKYIIFIVKLEDK